MFEDDDERDDWLDGEVDPPEFQPLACLVVLGLSLLFWAIVVACVTWLVIR